MAEEQLQHLMCIISRERD